MMSLGWNLVWTIINLIVLYLLMKKFLIGPVLGIIYSYNQQGKAGA